MNKTECDIQMLVDVPITFPFRPKDGVCDLIPLQDEDEPIEVKFYNFDI